MHLVLSGRADLLGRPCSKHVWPLPKTGMEGGKENLEKTLSHKVVFKFYIFRYLADTYLQFYFGDLDPNNPLG